MAKTTKKRAKKKTTKKKTAKKQELSKKPIEQRARILAEFTNQKAEEFEAVIKEAASKLNLEIELKVFLDIKNFSNKNK